MEIPAVLPLTTRTRISLAIARAFAAARGDMELTPTHVLWGMLQEGGNPALATMAQAGLSLNAQRALQHEIEGGLAERPGRTSPRQVALDLTPGEQKLVDQADALAQRRGDPFLGTEHFLLAILGRGDDPAAQALARNGITLDAALEGLKVVYSGTPLPPTP